MILMVGEWGGGTYL